jgi:hypothetical protein
MDNGTMLGELIAELSVLNRLIGHEAALAGDADDGKHAVHLDGFDSERASRAIALNQGQNGILVRRTLVELHIPPTFRHSRRPILDRRWAQANRRMALLECLLLAPSCRELFGDLLDDSCAFNRTGDAGGVYQRALSRLEGSLNVVRGEDFLFEEKVQNCHCNGPANQAGSEREVGDGRL